MASVVMPQPGQSVTEGTVIRWLKQVGDHVDVDDILVEVETEKVNVELPSPFEGTLAQILAQEGDTVPVGADLAVIQVAGESPAAEGAPVQAPVAAQAADGERPATSVVESAAEVSRQPVGAGVTRNGARGEGAATRYSPAVLRLAAEHNLDLARVPGSGLGGRVTRKDVAQFLERGPEAAGITEERELAAPFTGPPPAAPAPAAEERPAAPAPPPARVAAVAAGEDEEIIRPSATRLTIARNMLRTAQSVPAAWMVVEVDVTGLVRLRERHREAFRGREGVDLTYLPFVVQVVTAALREHPMLNSEWREDQIVLKKRVNMGVAVGVEDGLIVPVIHNADRLSLTGLAHAINDLATRARARKLTIEDVTNGTFTIDNTGVFGSLVSQPIINPPQAAILSTEAIVKRPVVLDDSIAVRSMMNLCITFDHRIVDGSHVGPFMQSIKRRLEAYSSDAGLT